MRVECAGQLEYTYIYIYACVYISIYGETEVEEEVAGAQSPETEPRDRAQILYGVRLITLSSLSPLCSVSSFT